MIHSEFTLQLPVCRVGVIVRPSFLVERTLIDRPRRYRESRSVADNSACSNHRPWLRGSLNSLDFFQSRIIRRIALKCGVDPCTIHLQPVSKMLDDRNINLAFRLLRNPDFSHFFENRQTSTGSRERFLVPLAHNDTVFHSFCWRLSRRLREI